jgi:hypothetical protein
MKNSEFSKRQLSLIGRLDKICKKIPKQILPVNIERIELFGSALRNKQNPGDLDLHAYYSDDESCSFLWNLFYEIFTKMDRNHELPLDAVLHHLKENFKQEQVKVLEPIFQNWFKDFKWGSLDYGDLSRDKVLRKVILKGVNEIHISDFILIGQKSSVKKSASGVVWSRTSLDVFSNMKKIWMPEILESNLWVDLESLDEQLTLEQSQLSMKKTLFEKLLTSKQKFQTYSDMEKWENKVLKKYFPNQKMRSSVGFCDDAVLKNYEFERKKYEKFDQDQLQNIVEEKRTSLKSAQKEFDVVSHLVRSLNQWYVRLHENPEWSENENVKTYLAMRALEDIVKREVNEKDIRYYLKKNKIPTRHIFTIPSHGGSGTLFRVAKTKEKELKLKNDIRSIEIKNEILKSIKPIVNKISKRFHVKIVLNGISNAYDEYGDSGDFYSNSPDQFKPTLVKIYHYFHNDEIEKQQELWDFCKNNNFVFDKRERGFYASSDMRGSSASLDIPIENFSKDEIKSKIKEIFTKTTKQDALGT